MFDEFSGYTQQKRLLPVRWWWFAVVIDMLAIVSPSLSPPSLSIPFTRLCAPSPIIIINEFWALIFWCAHSSMIMSSFYADNATTCTQHTALTSLFMYPPIIYIWALGPDADAEEFAACVFFRFFCSAFGVCVFSLARLLSQRIFPFNWKKKEERKRRRNLRDDICIRGRIATQANTQRQTEIETESEIHTLIALPTTMWSYFSYEKI